MSRKHFKVETAENGQTTIVKIEKTNVPTGKVTTLEDKKKRREEREQKYTTFRINALMRRAKRMKLSEDETKKAVNALIAQMKEPATYTILLMYAGSIRDNNGKMNPINKMVEEIITNNGMSWLMKSDYHMYIEGDQETLKKLREILPSGVKIHPYVKKKPTILPIEEPPKHKKPRNKVAKKEMLKKKKLDKRKQSIEDNKNRKKRAGKAFAKVQKRIKLLAAEKERKAKTVQMSNKKASTSLKKAA